MFINSFSITVFLSSIEKKFEYTEGVIRGRKSKDRLCNGQQKKYKRTNHDLQNTTQKTKDRVIRTPPKTVGEPRCCTKNSAFTVKLILTTSTKYKKSYVMSELLFYLLSLNWLVFHFLVHLPLYIFIQYKMQQICV